MPVGLVEVAGVFVGTVAVLVAFGLPVVLLAVPDGWRPWWPALVPIVGLATLMVVVSPFAQVLAAGDVGRPVTAVAVVVSVVAGWRFGRRLGRPSTAALVTVALSLVAAGFAYAPSVRFATPTPPGIINNDAFYYLVTDQWFVDHPVGDQPPAPTDDPVFTTAYSTATQPFRVGANLVDATVAAALGTSVESTIPAVLAVFVLCAVLGVGLFVIAVGGPGAAAALGAAIFLVRPETLRTALDAFVATCSALALVAALVGAITAALTVGGRRWVVVAGLLGAGMVSAYPEFLPFVVGVGLVTLATLLVSPRLADRADPERPQPRRRLLARAGGVALLAGALAPVATVRAAESVSKLASVADPRFSAASSPLEGLALLVGPLSQVDPLAADRWRLLAAVPAAALVVAGLVVLGRRAPGLALGLALASAYFVYRLRFGDPFEYGYIRALTLMAPFAAALAAVAVVGAARRHRVVGAAAILALVPLLGLSTLSAVQITRLALASGVTAGVDETRDLPAAVERLDPAGDGVLVENTDLTGVLPARQHFSVFGLRFRDDADGRPVFFDRNPLSYFLGSEPPPAAGGPRAPLYEWVVSLGPSLGHGRPAAAAGRYRIYRRDPVDVVVRGPHWYGIESDGLGRPFSWTDGSGDLWLSAAAPGRVRVTLNLSAPPGAARPFTLLAGDRPVARGEVPAGGDREVTSAPFAVGAGRTDLLLTSDALVIGNGDPRPLGVGLVSVRAEAVP